MEPPHRHLDQLSPDEAEADVHEQPFSSRVLAVHLALLQYPILGKTMRLRMREKLFQKGLISPERFFAEVQRKAIDSQQREHEPPLDEPVHQWQQRVEHTEDILTEFYYATNFTQPDFSALVEEVLKAKGAQVSTGISMFNPEIAPWELLVEQAKAYERLPVSEQSNIAHHLREIIVVLTKGMLSDQLLFVAIAKEILSIDDFERVRARRIGRGRIGGKAAGLTLCRKILMTPEADDPPDLAETLVFPESWYLGADIFYEYLAENGLLDLMNQKYLSHEEMVRSYPQAAERIARGVMPRLHRLELERLLERAGKTPLIVRSSSMLEDSFGVSFAGRYVSVFCPNQGSMEQNYERLSGAIKQVYASVLSPDTLTYRRLRGLIDYDERMGVLIQEVQGERHGDLYFPLVAGVGFSRSPVVWHHRINRKDGFLRIAAGLGTRAVDRLDDDFARMVALSHPTLQPFKTVAESVQYSQRQLDVINLRTDSVERLPARDLGALGLSDIGLIASRLVDRDTLQPLYLAGPLTPREELVISFDGLLRNRSFERMMKAVLKKLERHYGCPVDIEFTLEPNGDAPQGFRIHIVQCRQQSLMSEAATVETPSTTTGTTLLATRRFVADGVVSQVRYIIYVDPERYRALSDDRRKHLARVIGRLNEELAGEIFVLIGPGRWGSCNPDLGVPVSFGDIYNSRALIEVALPVGDSWLEASYGTHFFQELIESNIFPLAIYPGDSGSSFEFEFFRGRANQLARMLPDDSELEDWLRVIDLDTEPQAGRMELVMSSREELAVGYLKLSLQ